LVSAIAFTPIFDAKPGEVGTRGSTELDGHRVVVIGVTREGSHVGGLSVASFICSQKL
jgi:hypothetical protein